MLLPPSRSRRLRGLAVVACAAVALPVAAAAPAAAQTTSTSTSGATSASALRLVLNLPSALPLNPVQLDIDPVAGTVRAVPGSPPEAQAIAAIIAGSIGGEALDLGAASVSLAAGPRSASGSPLAELNDGLNSSGLGDFLQVGLAELEATVTEAPSSAASAGTQLALGLPQPIADALAQVLEPLLAAVEELLAAAAAELGTTTEALCAGLTPVTEPLGDALETVPGAGELLGDVVDGVTAEQAGLLCTLATQLQGVYDELLLSLEDLAGPGGLIDTGVLTTAQSIVTEGSTTTSTAQARIAGVTLLGQDPFGTANALDSTSTAVLGTGTADATVDVNAVSVEALPLLELAYDFEELRGQLLTIPLDGLGTLLDEIEAVLEALNAIGLDGGLVGDPDATLESCPTTLGASLSGTFEQPGVCAAAATPGYGFALTLPAELATALDVTGPLLQLTFSPSAALAGAATTTTAAPPAPQDPQDPQVRLPRTGAETALAGLGLVLLVGAALLRRRRAAAVGPQPSPSAGPPPVEVRGLRRPWRLRPPTAPARAGGRPPPPRSLRPPRWPPPPRAQADVPR
ncbi:MAG: hypothetical protein ACLGIG_09850 [Actinomycetes bacterium]